jgi:hypothetical protein
MPLDPTASNLAASDGPALVACPAIEPFTPGAGPTPLSKAPAQALNICVDGKYDAAKKAYTFDLATLAGDWAAGAPANGVVIRPKQTQTTQFNYAFLGLNKITIAAVYSASTPGLAPTVPAPAADAGSGFAAAPPAGFSGGPPVAPLNPVSAPVTAPQPQVLPPAAPVVAAPAAAPSVRPVAETLRPGGAFWLMLLVIAGLLLAAGLVLGDPLEPVVLDTRRRRFADVVRARVAARAQAESARPAPAAPRARPA